MKPDLDTLERVARHVIPLSGPQENANYLVAVDALELLALIEEVKQLRERQRIADWDKGLAMDQARVPQMTPHTAIEAGEMADELEAFAEDVENALYVMFYSGDREPGTELNRTRTAGICRKAATFIEQSVAERDKATAECAVLRESLQWYAEAETYRYQSMKTFPPVMSDCGERARKALSKTPTLGTRLLDVVEAAPRLLSIIERLLRQAESDLESAHAEICRLQNLDPQKHRWPEWTPQANSLRWFDDIRKQIEPVRDALSKLKEG